MNCSKFSALFLMAVAAVCLWTTVEAGGDKKGDMMIIGGGHGCGPELLMKTGGKKSKSGDLLMINPCKKKVEVEHKYVSYPVMPSYEESYKPEYGYDESYGGHDSYGHGGYDGY